LGIPLDLVSVAKTALGKHSQNDVLYDPKEAINVSKEELKLADGIFKWSGLPYNCETSMEEFKAAFNK